MNIRVPSLRRHRASGQWCTKWGERVHYFGHDHAAALVQYTASIESWRAWRQQRKAQALPPPHRTVHVADLIDAFLDHVQLQGGPCRRRFYANHLRRFAEAAGEVQAQLIRPQHLADLRDDMITGGMAPKTIAHDLASIRTAFTWASLEGGLIPLVNFRAIHSPPLPPPAHKALSRPQLRRMLRAAPDHLRPWLAINYLALMRVSEVVRVVHHQGTWERPWLFRLHYGKSDSASGQFRRIVFSAEARSWLDRCEPRWSRQDTYYQAVARAGVPYPPHPLRHTAATHLRLLGVAVSEIDLLLGHLPRRVTLTYVQIDWRSLRQTASRLSLRSVL